MFVMGSVCAEWYFYVTQNICEHKRMVLLCLLKTYVNIKEWLCSL